MDRRRQLVRVTRRGLAIAGLALAATTMVPDHAAGQHVLEARAGSTEYRYLDWNHTWRGGAVADAFYVGVPGSNEVNVGGGIVIKRGDLTVTPLGYAVVGAEARQRGVKLALLVSIDHRGWRLASFLGQYLRLGGEVGDYLVLDTFDLTRLVGRGIEVGVQSGFFKADGQWNEQVGPLLKANDRRGAWAASFRFGADDELRVGRTILF